MERSLSGDPPIKEPPPPSWHTTLGDAHTNGDRRGVVTEPNAHQMIARGKALVAALLSDDPQFRKDYYDLSRDWHDHFYEFATGTNLDLRRLAYGEELCKKLEGLLPNGSRLELKDAANMHSTAFWMLRRALFALTAHDVDPDSGSLTLEADSPRTEISTIPGSADWLIYLLSWHWTPNGLPSDTSVSPSTNSAALGLEPSVAP